MSYARNVQGLVAKAVPSDGQDSRYGIGEGEPSDAGADAGVTYWVRGCATSRSSAEGSWAALSWQTGTTYSVPCFVWVLKQNFIFAPVSATNF